MGLAPYHRSYRRAGASGACPVARYPPNPARGLTDQGGDPDPADLGWCIRHEWRVIYYTARYAAGLPIWPGADDFELLMTDVLFRLSSAFKPIPPIRSREVATLKDDREDWREDRILRPSCRVYPTPTIERWGPDD